MFKTALKKQIFATIFALIISLIGVLIISLLASAFNFNSNVIKPINQVLKTVAIVVSSLLFLRDEKGFIKGATLGVSIAFLTALLASFLSGGFSSRLVVDLLVFGLIGAISGVIAVNLK